MVVRFADLEAESPETDLAEGIGNEMSGALPTLTTDAEGYVVSADVEEMIDLAIQNAGELTPEEEAQLRSPEFAQTVSESAGNRTWSPWIETWLGLEIEPGETLTVEDAVTLADGTSVPLPMEWHHDGWADDGESVSLRWRQVVEGDAFELLMADTLSALSGEDAPELTGSMVREVSATFSPDTLRPTEVLAVETTSVDGGQRARVDERFSTFDWDLAEGC